MKRVLFLAPIALFVVVLVVFFVGLRRDPSALPSALIDKPVPAFILPPLRPEDSRGFAATDLGGEPMLVNVYASWCGPCKLEHPMLMRLKREGVIIHGVDWKDTREAGYGFLAERGDPFVRVGSDQSGRTGIDLGVAGAPETFVIDKAGKVRYRHIGAISIEDWEQKIGPLLQRLRAES
ncbi:DsbE family thiol:disulfide interchange protein [uncultured Phenylobacterium sp.]|uniref:DsbE family thiol:disulfide interchange protein n=1 Tax=uncultured Phenylobacterium sp. TaxID=349273 RepID=UPI0025D4FB37|nr:DsbE family thiol:disulfide interchange protein [uncultured Phenylobacterium sp.]